MRIVLARSPETKAKAEQVLPLENVEQKRSASVVTMRAFDMKFYDYADVLAPAMGNPERMGSLLEAALETMALRTASHQVGYFILTARVGGMDC